MARGGRRSGAGRPKGAANQKTSEIASKAASEGVTPLEVMLDNMRWAHEKAAVQLKDVLSKGCDDRESAVSAFIEVAGLRKIAQDAAKDAAPYMHPRLASTEVKGEGGGPLKVVIQRFSD